MSEGEFPEPKPPPLAVVVSDPVVRGKVEETARRMEWMLLGFRTVGECRLPAPPRAYVVDLRLDDALDGIRAWKEAEPDVPVIAVLALPEPGLWTEAEDAGADFVATHGTVHRKLPDLLTEYAERRKGVRRIRVAPQKEFEGRLGYVGRISDDVPEEIALYHIGYEICAVSNVCPHAGGRLSDGELEGAVVTCPLHGSRFDVCSGERLRGPSDDPIHPYRVVIEDGYVFVELEDG